MTTDASLAALQQAVVQLAKNNVALRADVERLGKQLDSLPCAIRVQGSAQKHGCQCAHADGHQNDGCTCKASVNESRPHSSESPPPRAGP